MSGSCGSAAVSGRTSGWAVRVSVWPSSVVRVAPALMVPYTSSANWVAASSVEEAEYFATAAYQSPIPAGRAPSLSERASAASSAAPPRMLAFSSVVRVAGLAPISAAAAVKASGGGGVARSSPLASAASPGVFVRAIGPYWPVVLGCPALCDSHRVSW